MIDAELDQPMTDWRWPNRAPSQAGQEGLQRPHLASKPRFAPQPASRSGRRLPQVLCPVLQPTSSERND